MVTRRRSGALLLLLAPAMAILAFFFLAVGGAAPAQAQDDDTTTTIIDGGGGAKGYEPTNVQVVPGDGELTLSWNVTSRPGVEDNEIYHAVRWSQTLGVWDNPGAPPNAIFDDPGLPIDGFVLEPGVTSYKITGLKNRVVTGVHVRSFTGQSREQTTESSSHWVRVKGKDTTPVADEVIFDEAGYSVAEGGTVILDISRYAINDASLNDPLTFTLDTADGTAASTDYTAFAGRSVTMATSVATASSIVATTSDGLVEEDETLTVSISVPGTSIFGAGNPSTATVTIQDDDRAGAKIAFGTDAASTTKYAATVAENVTGGTLNVPVTVSHLPGASTTFAVEVLSGGTAGEGSDFSIATKSVTFGPTTAKTQNVAITLTDDTDYEEDETIELRIVAADATVDDLGDYYARDAAGATATVTVTSEDPALAPKTYALSSAASATEGGNAELTLTLGENAPSGGLAFTVSATYATAALGKASPSDTNNLRSTTHTVAANKSRDTISIPIATDGLVEGTETFTVAVTADDASWSVDSNRGNTATITIISKDRESAEIAFGTDAASTMKYVATVAENVTGGTLNVPVTVSHLPGTSTTFAVEVLPSGSAGEGSDFSIAGKSVTFGPTTAKTQNVAITLTDDGDYEENETIELRIIAADATVDDLGDYYARDTAGSTAAVTVTSEESRIAFGTDPGSTTKYTDRVSEAVTGGTFNLPVTASHLPGASTTFAVEVLPGGTAVEGSDFSIAVKSVTFGPTTARTQNLAITLTDDSDYEEDETIQLRIVAADNPANDLGDHYARDAGATATVIITSDDATTTIIDGGGRAKGYEPTNVRIVPGDGELTVSWAVTSRPDEWKSSHDEIWHAVRWSQTHGAWDNPGAASNRHIDSTGLPIDGIVLEPGVTSYKITGLQNWVVTGVHVRSFGDPTQRTAAAEKSSHWVRVKGASTTPVGDGVTFDEAGYSVTEGGTVTLRLTRYGATDASLDGSLTVTLAAADGTATSSDYTPFTSRAVTMAANSGAATSSVVTTSDDLVEEDETLTVSMSVPQDSPFRAGDPSTTTITIEDDDRANARIAFGSDAASTTKYTATVAEAVSGGTFNLPVTVSHLPGASTTFAVEVLSGGTAGEGSDFSIAAKSVTFGPTDTSKTKNVAIAITNDADYENDETIQLRIVAADATVDDLGDYYVRDAAGSTATVTVTSEDARSAGKTYALSSAVTATEGGKAQLTLTLGEATTEPLAFKVTATYTGPGAGKAVPHDVGNFRSATHTVAANKSSDTISISIPADRLLEDAETFTVTVSTDDIRWRVASAGANTATVTINDKDRTTAKVAFGTNAASTTKYTATVNEAGGVLRVPISVNHYTPGSITFSIEVLETSTAGPPPRDYRVVNKSATFASGQSQRTQYLRFFINDDSAYEGDETIELRIVAADNPVNDLGDHFTRHASGATATITITDDESHFVTASSGSLGVAEGKSATYTVVLTDEPTDDVIVTPVRSSGRATVSGPVTFTRTNWSVPQEITVTGKLAGEDRITHSVSSDDANFSSAKTFSVDVRVTAPTREPAPTPTPTATPGPTKFYEITSAATAAEGQAAELTVTLSEAAPADLTFNVNYKYEGSTATAADTPARRPTTVTVTTGNTTATLRVPIARDSQVESDEILKLSITPGQGVTTDWGEKADGADSAAITIQDATITVSLGQDGYSVGEGDRFVSVPITFGSPTKEDLTVVVRTVTGRNTATHRDDFTFPTSGVKIARGSTTFSYRVDIVDNGIPEPDEEIHLRLRSVTPSAGYAIVSAQDTVITITDDDTPGVTVSETARSVIKSATTTYTVTLDSKPTADVTVTPTSGAMDYATVSGAVTFTPQNWNQPKTITVTGVKAGKATISHEASSSDTSYTSALSIDSVAVTVTSDSLYQISSAVTADEGDDADLTITLQKDAPAGGLQFTVTPTYAAGAGKAAAADLSAPPATVSVAANQRTATLSIPIARDALVEGDETFTVVVATSATGWNKSADGADTATVTITDLTREVSLAASSYSVGESDGKVTVGLSVSGAHADTITATLTFTDVSATRSTDYGGASATAQATFASGETSSTLDVAILTDDLSEGSETFTMTITAVSTGHAIHASNNAATVTITDDDAEGVTVTPTNLSVVEFGNATYTVALGTMPTANVTVTPTSGATDHATVSAPVTFTTGNWSTPQEITVTGVQEGNATISHAVTSDDGKYAALTPNSVAVTVTAYGKTYALTPAVTASEDDSALMSITLGENAPEYGLTFEIEVTFDDPAPGKAQAGDVGNYQRTLPVAGGKDRTRFWIPLVSSDLAGEADETFTVSIKKVHVRNIPVPEWKVDPSGTDSGTVTIEDADASIAFGPDAAATTRYAASVAENVSGGTLNVPVTVSHLPIESTTFKIAVAATSTATAYTDDANPGDYRIADKTVTFGPTDSSKTKNVVIAINDDDDVETPETIALSIAAAADPVVSLGDRYARDAAGATATITINSEEAAAGSTKTYTIRPSITVKEGETAQLTVVLGENAPAGGLEFSVAYGGSRTTPNSLSVTAGADRATLNIPVSRNSGVTAQWTFTVTISTTAPGWAVASDGTNQATVTVLDSTQSISFSAGGYTVIEGSAARVVVTRTGPTEDPATVSVTGFGRGPIRGVRSYFKETVAIPAGASAAALAIQTNDDSRVEGDGTVGLIIGSPSAGYRLVGSAYVSLVIKDNDGAQQYASTYTMEDSAVTANEGENARLTINLGEPAHEDGLEFSVYYDYSKGGATEDDTGNTPSTLTVTAGSDTATLSIPIAADAEVDAGESFVVSITPGTSDTDWTVAPNGSASATVSINDAAPALQGASTPAEPVTFGTATVSDLAYTVGASAVRDSDLDTTLWDQGAPKLPAATGGSGALTYTATGLPAGLTMDRHRVIRGTPLAATTGPVTVTYTAADGEGAGSASLTFQVTVNPPVTFDDEELAPFTHSTIEYTVGQATPLNFQLPEASGGTGTLTYYLANRDPQTPISEYAQGLTFDSATRTLSSGVGQDEPAAGQRYAVVYWAEDENHSMDSAYSSIIVNGPPSLPEIAPQNFTAGDAVSITLPAATGGATSIVRLRYRLEPQVPGLSFNPGSRTLAGTATVAGSTTLTYTATDRNGVSDTETFTIAVASGPGAPSAAPGSLQAYQFPGRKLFMVTWEEVTGATGYVVQVAAGGDGFPTDNAVSSWPEGYHVSVQGYNLRAAVTVPEFGNYQVRVAAVNAAGAGPWAMRTMAAAEPQPQSIVKTYSITPTIRVVEGPLVFARFVIRLNEPAPSSGLAFTVTNRFDATADAADVVGGTKGWEITVAGGTRAVKSSVYIKNDDIDEDDETFTLAIAPTTATDWEKAGDGQDTATITIEDDDTAGVTVTAANPLNASEVGTATYTVVLDSRPTASVTVTPTSADAGAATVSPASYLIPPANWNTPVTFTVSGVVDDDSDDESVSISHRLTSQDAKYAALSVDSVAVSVTDTTPLPERGSGNGSPQQVGPPNHAPTVSSAIADATIVNQRGTHTVSLSGVFSDADNDALTIAASSSDETVATVTVAPDYSSLTVNARARGVATITVTAEDGNVGLVADTFTVTVKAAPVVASAPPNVSGLEAGATKDVSLSGVFSDADGDNLTVTAASSDEAIATVTVAPNGSALTLTGVAEGTATITVTAQDTDGNRVSDAFAAPVAKRYASLIARMYEWRDDPCCASDKAHTDRWDRTLFTFGETVADTTLTPMTADEAQGYVDRGWERWVPVAAALRELENQAPTVSSPIADVSGLEVDATQEVSLSGVFSDPDGDNLTITAASSDEAIATVTVASKGSTLTLIGVAEGTVTITVTAQDAYGNRVSDTFDAPVARKYNALIAEMYEWRNDPCCASDRAHTDRWDRTLLTFGETVTDTTLTVMTADEAQGYADRGWERWVPVAAALREIEANQ